MTTNISRLKRICLREAWKHEATEFTPWLSQTENLNQLADALGLSELELIGIEHQVGDFKLDIFCSDDEGEVIIENQLEKTNHSHLGQIITYAAGVGAKKVIWVAESFRPEHIAAFEFLNQHTTHELNFFAVEIELWRIEQSPLAPSFNVVVKPNDWSKINRENARVASTTTPTKQLQQKFWMDWGLYLGSKKSPLKPQKARPQHWSNLSLGRAGFNLAATVNSRENRIGLEIYISHQNSKLYFSKLKEQANQIEQRLGFEMDWQELPESHACRIAIYRNNAPLASEANWHTYFDWLTTTGQQIDQVFRPIVKVI